MLEQSFYQSTLFRRFLFPVHFLLFFSFWILFVWSQIAHASVNDLLNQADQLKLSTTPAWRALLHYPKDAKKSLIDDPAFFLSDQGQTNPDSELRATIAAFSLDNHDPERPPAKCRFIARYLWLQEKLPLAASQFTNNNCPEWDDLNKRIKPHAVTLIYPTGHLNSPASMFGHTLLRIDPPNNQSLLGYAVNYAAHTAEENGLLFAYYGIFGHYKGYYSLLPYTEKLREYRFTEQRDLWEYRLNFSQAETERLLAHTFELKNIYSYYYFFDENCSYNLLALLEAARLELDLLSGREIAVIPTDTIRRIESNHLIAKRHYRPSHVSVLNRMQRKQSAINIKAARQLADPSIQPANIQLSSDTNELRLSLDTAIEFLQYKQSRRDITLQDFRTRYIHLLSTRSQLGGQSDNHKTPPPEPTSGHKSKRLSLSLLNQGKEQIGLLRYRPAYHSLEDHADGYLNGSGISFLDTTFHHNFSNGKTRLDSIRILTIDSITPVSPLLKPLSWRLSLAIEPEKSLIYNNQHRLILDGGVGRATDLDGQGKLMYGFAQLRLSDQEKLTHSFDLGIKMGLLLPLGDKINFSLLAEHWQSVRSTHKQENNIEASLGWRLHPDHVIRGYTKTAPKSDAGDSMIGIRYDWFF